MEVKFNGGERHYFVTGKANEYFVWIEHNGTIINYEIERADSNPRRIGRKEEDQIIGAILPDLKKAKIIIPSYFLSKDIKKDKKVKAEFTGGIRNYIVEGKGREYFVTIQHDKKEIISYDVECEPHQRLKIRTARKILKEILPYLKKEGLKVSLPLYFRGKEIKL